jgi:cyclohexanone monooxygenase
MKPTVAILGAGAGGLAMAIALKKAKCNDFVIYEKSDGVGGTWRDNTYPGAACDVPSQLYSYSFEPNANWSRVYSGQAEILAYLEHCADKYGIRPHLRCHTAIVEARWSDDEQRWHLRSAAGESFVADILVSGLGMLNVPYTPEFAGLENFEGKTFHSSRWEHDYELAGKRVGVIGTGASAVQFVPAIAPDVDQLTVFQRSPCWVMPKGDRAFTEEEKAEFARKPSVMRRARWKTWKLFNGVSFEATGERTQQMTAYGHGVLAKAVVDPALRAMLTPDFPPGCKRPLISNDWYPALQRENVHVVPQAVDGFTAKGVRTADGQEHELDAVIFGTGFKAHDYLTSIEMYGAGGRRLHDDWADGAEAYLGITVAGYPNLFLLYGPNTNGVNSVIFFHEVQVKYIMRALRAMRRRRVASVDVKRSVMDAFNVKVQEGVRSTVWVAGCSNYYAAPSGKVVTQLPMSGRDYWWRTRWFPIWKFDTRHRSARRAAATAGASRSTVLSVTTATDAVAASAGKE